MKICWKLRCKNLKKKNKEKQTMKLILKTLFILEISRRENLYTPFARNIEIFRERKVLAAVREKHCVLQLLL